MVEVRVRYKMANRRAYAHLFCGRAACGERIGAQMGTGVTPPRGRYFTESEPGVYRIGPGSHRPARGWPMAGDGGKIVRRRTPPCKVLTPPVRIACPRPGCPAINIVGV
jgi:hypothetical protein